MPAAEILETMRVIYESGPHAQPGMKHMSLQSVNEIKAAYYDELSGLLDKYLNAHDFEREENYRDEAACRKDGICQMCGQNRSKKED